MRCAMSRPLRPLAAEADSICPVLVLRMWIVLSATAVSLNLSFSPRAETLSSRAREFALLICEGGAGMLLVVLAGADTGGARRELGGAPP